MFRQGRDDKTLMAAFQNGVFKIFHLALVRALTIN